MALIPPSYRNAIVALGDLMADGSAKYHSTGFLYGWPTGAFNEEGQALQRNFLVTNRHVFESANERNANLQARFNTTTGNGSNIYPIDPKSDHWTVHPEADIAVLSVNGKLLEDDGIAFLTIHRDNNTFNREQLREKGIIEGDGVFTMGFPLGIAGDERNYVIVRQGIIASIQNWLDGGDKSFLIDASIYPGNSGGPVFAKPEVAAISGTTANNACRLIGIVSRFLAYTDIAVSQQTNRARVTFEENSGLGVVVPNDLIQETIREAVANS